MLQEMEIHKALKAFAGGKNVMVLQPMFEGCELKNVQVSNLDDWFKDCRLLVDVVATIDPVFGEAVQEMEKQIEKPAPNDSEVTAGAEKPAGKSVGADAKRKKVDTGKLLALHQAGWTNAKIADEMGMKEKTVWYYINKARKEKQKDGDGNH